MIDHLVLAGPSLDELVGWFVAQTGVVPEPGGQHVGVGTRNALVGVGGSTYVELIGPDPQQPTPAAPLPFGIDDLDRPTLVTWCLRPGSKLETAAVHAASNGFDPGEIASMSRRRADGTLLEWSLTRRAFGGPDPVPFLIDWGSSTHPTASLDHPVQLRGLELNHPEAERLSDLMILLDTPVVVTAGHASLRAVLATPRGDVEL